MLKLIVAAPVILITFLVFAGIGWFMFRRFWNINEPTEVLVVMKRKKKSRKKVVSEEATGTGDMVEAIKNRVSDSSVIISTTPMWVNPVTARVFKLKIDSRNTNFSVSCHDKNKIAVKVEGVIMYKVGDNDDAREAAARRFLSIKEDALNKSIGELVTGQVRAMVGGMTVEQLITDRETLIKKVSEATVEEMAVLGLQIDNLNIQDIKDDNEYIENIGRPEAEAARRAASIATDQARQAKEEAKQAADLFIAEKRRNTEVEASKYRAEEEAAKEKASQAGPLARAEAEAAVVEKQTHIAELNAQRTEKELEGKVKKAADANLYAAERKAEADKAQAVAIADAEAQRVRLLGEANANSTELTGKANAEAVRAMATAKAEGILKTAEALEKNGDAVIQQKLADNMPNIVRAASEPFANVDNFVITNGAEGFGDSLVTAIAAAGGAIDAVKGLDRPNTKAKIAGMTDMATKEINTDKAVHVALTEPVFSEGSGFIEIDANQVVETMRDEAEAELAAAAEEKTEDDSEFQEASQQVEKTVDASDGISKIVAEMSKADTAQDLLAGLQDLSGDDDAKESIGLGSTFLLENEHVLDNIAAKAGLNDSAKLAFRTVLGRLAK